LALQNGPFAVRFVATKNLAPFETSDLVGDWPMSASGPLASLGSIDAK
jgi:hypothetical protein